LAGKICKESNNGSYILAGSNVIDCYAGSQLTVIVRRRQFICSCKLAVVFWSWQDSLCLLTWWVTSIFTCFLHLYWWVSDITCDVNSKKSSQGLRVSCHIVHLFLITLFVVGRSLHLWLYIRHISHSHCFHCFLFCCRYMY